VSGSDWPLWFAIVLWICYPGALKVSPLSWETITWKLLVPYWFFGGRLS